MALQAERVAFGAQQMIVVAAVRGVASSAALRKGRLVVEGLFSSSTKTGCGSAIFPKPR